MISATMRIALLGKSGAGKTEVAKHLSAEYGFQPCKTGPICRKIATILFGNASKSNMQVVSDALIRIEPSIFLKAALREAEEHPRVLIDSLRYRTDYELAKSSGYITIRVVAKDESRAAFLKSRGEAFDLTTEGVHQTETELDDAVADIIILNDGTVEDLRRKVDGVLTAI